MRFYQEYNHHRHLDTRGIFSAFKFLLLLLRLTVTGTLSSKLEGSSSLRSSKDVPMEKSFSFFIKDDCRPVGFLFLDLKWWCWLMDMIARDGLWFNFFNLKKERKFWIIYQFNPPLQLHMCVSLKLNLLNLDGFSSTTSNETRLLAFSLFTLLWCLRIFLWASFGELDDKRPLSTMISY